MSPRALEFGAGSTGITYSQQQGTYTRIGRVVFFEISIVLTSKGSSTGAATFDGLPITVASPNHVCAINRFKNFTFDTDYTTLSGTITNATITLALKQSKDNAGNVDADDTNFADDSNMFFEGFYIV